MKEGRDSRGEVKGSLDFSCTSLSPRLAGTLSLGSTKIIPISHAQFLNEGGKEKEKARKRDRVRNPGEEWGEKGEGKRGRGGKRRHRQGMGLAALP